MRYSCSLLAGLIAVPFLNISPAIHGDDINPANAVQFPDPAAGFPSRDASLDVLPGFKTPPAGYGEVPYWWWTGDTLDVDRMIVQLKELHKKGISGVQVNYSHYDGPGWLTDQDEPGIFTENWWKVYSKVSEACATLDMGIGMSTYTIDWPRGASNLFYRLFYSKPELNAIELGGQRHPRIKSGVIQSFDYKPDHVAAHAYPVAGGKVQRGGVDLAPLVKDGKITWTAPEGEWEVWTFQTQRHGGSLNPLRIGSGQTVIRDFFQPFQDHNPGKSSKGLNYFFNDELQIGVGKFAWNPDFAGEFRKRKGYDLFEVLPAMWDDMGSITPKVRMDYADVRMALMEERYFKPIYTWHASRGMIYACDTGGRGTDPHEFGDYFRVTRWYTAPGHDTPGGSADLIKGKVSSSVANLYQRPRVWLEGYHSMGWGAAPERLMHATRENYLYGCTLLNLHGLYYTTYGSHWEWAPPCYHFRMPYWAHMGTFLSYFDRLSYLLSQGHLVCDVAVVYPVAPYEAEMNGEKAKNAAFDLARKLMAAGINFEFIDNDSLARATVENGRLVVKDAGASYQALVLTDMDAVRWPTIEKAAAFAQAGGTVYNVGALPTVSDHAGRDDAELTAMNDRAFKSECRLTKTEDAVEAIRKAFVQDVRGEGQTVRAIHRKAGARDVYMVMDAGKDSVVEFRAKGAVDLWDPWTGTTSPLRVVAETSTGTKIELPLESFEAQVVVFTPDKKHANPPPREKRSVVVRDLPKEWTVSFVPTMDNRYGDFRIPVTPDNKMIGLEARRFTWARETDALAKTALQAGMDDKSWEKKLHGYGTQFYVLGPVPNDVDAAQLDAELAMLRTVDPTVPVRASGKTLNWRAYDFSWRYGREGDLGHQGYHGLKHTVTDDFLCLGKKVGGLNETRYESEADGTRYYLWTCATVAKAEKAAILISRGAPEDKSHTSPVITPTVVYVNGAPVADIAQAVSLNAGANPVLVRYDKAGRGHFVMRRVDEPLPAARQPLAMRWYGDAGVIPFDVSAGHPTAEWFKFVSAPGTAGIRVPSRGKVQAWINREPMIDKGSGHFVAEKTSVSAAVVALRVVPDTGMTGGAAVPEPVVVETEGTGVMAIGDWSQIGILNNYSGGASYRTVFACTSEEVKAHVAINLGNVAATAEVIVNGRKAGVRVAPPWRVDVTGLLKEGENRIEVLVYNTLANHYQTIPSNYRGNPVSGLIGPVTIEVMFGHPAGNSAGAAKPAWDDLPAAQPVVGDWPWWCGPDRDNIAAPGQNPPLKWSKTANVIWRSDVPGRGHGSPCLWGDSIFLPAADDAAEVQSLLCFDRRTGQKRWQTEVHRKGFMRLNQKNSHATATPACDGQLVFMPFVIQDAIWLSALDFDGKIVWQKRLGDFKSMHGYAASPLVYKSLVIIAADNLTNSFLTAVHRRTGERIWTTDRPSYRLGTYASPTLGLVAGRDQLLHHGPMKVFSYDPLTGEELWTCDGPSESASSMIAMGRDLIYSSVGFPRQSMLCIRADGRGDVTKTHVVWSKKDKMPYVPSPLLAVGLIYLVEDSGNAYCFAADTGEEIWKAKLEGQFSSSPVLAGGHIYVANEDGVCFVFKAGRRFELVATNDLADGGFATPVICDSRIYLRTLNSLYCLGLTP